MERQLTFAPHGHILTNTAVWSPDSRWIVYDVRSDPAGAVFDGTRIERVHIESGEVQVLYESRHQACCGVATYCPVDEKVVFIHGPEHPTTEWCYSASHRRGVLVEVSRPGQIVNLDACDLVPPFTPGALRGGTHVHTFSGDGQWIAFTYEDHVLDIAAQSLIPPGADVNQRNVGVSVPGRPVQVPRHHPRNHNGTHFSVLVTRTVNDPRPGSDEICRAFEEGWVGVRGYVKSNGQRQHRALAFQGLVCAVGGDQFSEVFIVDLPDEVTEPSREGPLQGTATRRPLPPMGTTQRRLTFTEGRKFPGLQGPRHWLRSSPAGDRIALLMKDDRGIVQIWTISPQGGSPVQVTENPASIGSAFTWSPDGKWLAHVMDRSICITDMTTGISHRLTPRSDPAAAPRPEACVFAPDGRHLAYVRPVAHGNHLWNQVFVLALEE